MIVFISFNVFAWALIVFMNILLPYVYKSYHIPVLSRRLCVLHSDELNVTVSTYYCIYGWIERMCVDILLYGWTECMCVDILLYGWTECMCVDILLSAIQLYCHCVSSHCQPRNINCIDVTVSVCQSVTQHELNRCDYTATQLQLYRCDCTATQHELYRCDYTDKQHELYQCDCTATHHELYQCDYTATQHELHRCDYTAIQHELYRCDCRPHSMNCIGVTVGHTAWAVLVWLSM